MSVVLPMYILSVSKLVTTEFLRTGEDIEWVCWLSMGGKSSFEHAASSSVEHVQKDGCFRSRQSLRYST